MNNQAVNHSHYLQEMGIDIWVPTYPQSLSGPDHKEALPASCRLLFVSPEKPESASLLMFFSKILASMDLKLEQVQHIFPHQFPFIDIQSVEWVWFAGTQPETVEGAKQLVSPLLDSIDGNNQERRALWTQITSYEG